ncbi:hypothetical protein HZ326_29844 [Fusarium oxysporum f. sp. albedinis]|nr:hypothetical protein HZ326_29844 [Fusarium oxysporum f. sp. albedinis]
MSIDIRDFKTLFHCNLQFPRYVQGSSADGATWRRRFIRCPHSSGAKRKHPKIAPLFSGLSKVNPPPCPPELTPFFTPRGPGHIMK